jgi:integrase
VPFERTKGKITRRRVEYRVPLPPMAQNIFRSMARHDAHSLFKPINFQRLKTALVRFGAPKDFQLHVARHTIATWLENQNHTEWERALVLNHASSGVTAGYSHGYPLELKRQLLCDWITHVERLVQS